MRADAANQLAKRYARSPNSGGAENAAESFDCLAEILAQVRRTRAASRFLGTQAVERALVREQAATTRLVEGLSYYDVPETVLVGNLPDFNVEADMQELLSDLRQIHSCAVGQMPREISDRPALSSSEGSCDTSALQSRYSQQGKP